jgi:hypothetical protein
VNWRKPLRKTREVSRPRHGCSPGRPKTTSGCPRNHQQSGAEARTYVLSTGPATSSKNAGGLEPGTMTSATAQLRFHGGRASAPWPQPPARATVGPNAGPLRMGPHGERTSELHVRHRGVAGLLCCCSGVRSRARAIATLYAETSRFVGQLFARNARVSRRPRTASLGVTRLSQLMRYTGECVRTPVNETAW